MSHRCSGQETVLIWSEIVLGAQCNIHWGYVLSCMAPLSHPPDLGDVTPISRKRMSLTPKPKNHPFATHPLCQHLFCRRCLAGSCHPKCQIPLVNAMTTPTCQRTRHFCRPHIYKNHFGSLFQPAWILNIILNLFTLTRLFPPQCRDPFGHWINILLSWTV